VLSASVKWKQFMNTNITESWSIGGPIILGRCPSLSAHESESMLRTYLACREKQEREREREKQTKCGRSTQCTNTSDPLLPCVSCYWGKTVSLCMLINLRLADLNLTTAQQRSTGQNLLSDLYDCFIHENLVLHSFLYCCYQLNTICMLLFHNIVVKVCVDICSVF
jgi:hypothetical protein